jgi:hypothetical protein
MKRRILLSFGRVTALSFLVVIAGIANQAAAEKLEGNALEEYLISRSPWSGEWSTLRPPGSGGSFKMHSGRVTYVFERLDGKFSARITKGTGGAEKNVGPVRGLSVEKDTIHLSTAGVGHQFRLNEHKFKLNEQGELVGKGTTSDGQSTDTLLKPTQ